MRMDACARRKCSHATSTLGAWGLSMDARQHNALYLFGLFHGPRLPARLALQFRSANLLPQHRDRQLAAVGDAGHDAARR